MARRIYKVESVDSHLTTLPSKTVDGAYEEGIAYQVGFRLADPSAKTVLLDGSLNIVAFNKQDIEHFTIGKQVTIEVIDNL